MIDRELLAQVMKSHIANFENIEPEASQALAGDPDALAIIQDAAIEVVQTGALHPTLGALMAIGFTLGREYESLSGREYRSKLTEPFGGL